MSRKRSLMTVLGVLGSAATIGFVMQSTSSAQELYGRPDIAKPRTAVSDAGALLAVRDISLTSGELQVDLDRPATDARVTKVAAPAALPSPIGPAAEPAPACDFTATARPVAAAMVKVGLDAPCLPDERVTVHHNGMIFTETTSDTGTLDLTLPALAGDAVFIFAFANGDGAVASTRVEDISDFRRVVVQWKGETGFEIHAREFGAEYGAPGHVWTGAPGGMADAVTGRSGMITRHGDAAAPEALVAEVYTFPVAASGRVGEVALSVETEVGAANCGLEIEAQALQMSADGDLVTRNLTMAVPDCDAQGSFLVLNNLLEDLKIAGG